MSNRIDRRAFIKSATASTFIPLLYSGCSRTQLELQTMALRPKKPAEIRGAFFYPPLEVVNRGKFEDTWRRQNWSTWPGNQFKPEEQQAKFVERIGTLAAHLDLTLKLDDKPIYTNAGIQEFIDQITRSRPDALLLVNFWNTLSAKLKAVLDAYDGPIIVYHAVGANHQLPPQHFETAKRVYYIHSIENFEAIERGLRSVHAHHRMTQSRMLRVSGKAKVRSEARSAPFGTSISTVPAADFNNLFDKVDVTRELESLARSVRAGAVRVTDLSDKALLDAVRAHEAVRQIMDHHQADAITIECLFLKHRKPCLSFAINNGALIPCGCENHLDATLTLMLGANLFGRGGFQHNPEFDTMENLYFASHCTCTTRLHGPGARPAPYVLRPFFHQLPKTVALDTQWPAGEPATLFKYQVRENQLNAWSGTIVDSPQCPPTGGCATRVLVKIDDVPDVRTIYPGPHPVLYCGDFTRQAKAYAELYDFEIRTNA